MRCTYQAPIIRYGGGISSFRFVVNYLVNRSDHSQRNVPVKLSVQEEVNCDYVIFRFRPLLFDRRVTLLLDDTSPKRDDDHLAGVSSTILVSLPHSIPLFSCGS